MFSSPRGRLGAFGIGALFLPFALSCRYELPPPVPDPTLEDFLPAPPAPTGDPQSVFAGFLTPENLAEERVDGPAAQGLPGDIFLRNDKIRLVLQQPGRAIALIPTGGNIVDADVVRDPSDPFFDGDGDPADGVGNDHWGEVAILLQLGRLIDPTRVEIVSDGSGGGAALIRFFGGEDINDFINLPGVLPIPLPDDLDPDRVLGYEAAIDYVLEPGADFVQVRYTVFNPSGEEVNTTVGVLGDIGGISEPFTPGTGFGGAGFGDLINNNVVAAPYAAVQSVGVGYGVLPFYLDPQTQQPDFEMTGVTLVIAGGLAIAYDTQDVGELLSSNFNQRGLLVPAQSASTVGFDFVIGAKDIGTAEARFVELRREVSPSPITGKVQAGGVGVPNARVGVFLSEDDTLDADELPLTVFSTDDGGNYGGALAPGSYLLVADAQGLRRGAPARVEVAGAGVEQDLDLPEPGRIAYNVQDVTGAPVDIPAKITVVGADQSPEDKRFRDAKASSHAAQSNGIVSTRHSLTGKSVIDPEGAIPVEDGRYRVFVTRGMEYDRHEEIIDIASGETVTINAALTRVVDSAGYIKADFHQHAITSPDAPVSLDVRAITYATEGTEFFASSDHDFRTDYEPILEGLGIDNLVDSIVGEETSTFAYGHFNAYPLPIDATLPNNGAIDWGRGREFLNLLPGEIFAGLRQEGARVVQINHPRVTGGLTNGAFFDQSRLNYDFDLKTFGSDLESLTNDVFRLEENVAMFDENFDTIELYNGFNSEDTNGDGVNEDPRVDLTLRDCFNFFSLGKVVSVVGSSDSHDTGTPVGAPGTYVRVPDDSEAAITSDAVREGVLAAISGKNLNGSPAARDAVATNAPLIRVEVGGQSAIGHLVPASAGEITLQIHVETPDWAEVDTLELFANQNFLQPTPGEPFALDALLPEVCFTARQNRQQNDTCDAALVGAQPLTVTRVTRNPTTGAQVSVVDVTVTINLDDLPNRGDTGDTWIVVRAYGTGSLFPFIPGFSGDILDVVENGTAGIGGGTFPLAITNAILVDADGDGQFTAPFAP